MINGVLLVFSSVQNCWFLSLGLFSFFIVSRFFVISLLAIGIGCAVSLSLKTLVSILPCIFLINEVNANSSIPSQLVLSEFWVVIRSYSVGGCCC